MLQSIFSFQITCIRLVKANLRQFGVSGGGPPWGSIIAAGKILLASFVNMLQSIFNFQFTFIRLVQPNPRQFGVSAWGTPLGPVIAAG